MARMTLEAARVNRGWTQAELAEKMGVSRQSVFDWENGKRQMRSAYVKLFCNVVGLEEDDIILPSTTTLSSEKR